MYRKGLQSTVMTAEALTSVFAAVGDVVDIRGMRDISLHVTAAGTDNTVLEVFVDPTAETAPADASASGMHLYATVAAGAAVDVTVPTGGKRLFPLGGLSGNFIAFKGKSHSTNGCTATVVVTGNVETGGQSEGL